MNRYHDELSEYLSSGLAVHFDGVTIRNENLEHIDLIVKEDDLYMKDFLNNEKGVICAVTYTRVDDPYSMK